MSLVSIFKDFIETNEHIFACIAEEYSTMCCWLQVNLQKLHWCLQFYLLPLNEIFHLPIVGYLPLLICYFLYK